MGLCAQTPGHIVVQEKGFSCTRIVYHNGRYFAYRKKYKFFSIFYIFSIYFSKKTGFMENCTKKRKKFRLAILK